MQVHTKTKMVIDVRHMVRFDIGSRSVYNAHVFKNKNGERHEERNGGGLHWHYTHSYKDSD